ncbi:MAG: transposase [Burkholderia sp.]|nr:MAG: IS630 family transposase ISCARN25 [Burkholderia gladioli]
MDKIPAWRVARRREGLSVISTVTNRIEVRGKVVEGAMNVEILRDFLKKLLNMSSKKVFLILDNLKVHHTKPLKAWLTEYGEKIEVFCLPSYSTDLNLDEIFKADLKANVTKQAPARTKGHLKKVVISHLRRLQKSPKRVALYFMHKPIRYTA